MLPEHDGLHEEWKYPTIYMNPPYGADRERGSTIKHWLAKCASTHRKYDSEILALVPGRNYNKFYDVFINYGAVVDISSLINEEIGETRKQPNLFSVL